MEKNWLYDALSKTVVKVFESMVFMKIDSKIHTDKVLIEDKHLTAMVGFAGVYMGLAAIHCSFDFARKIGGSMLSMEPDNLTEEDVRDALGEIANMISGYYKARLAEKLQTSENVFEQSVPTVISGDDYETCAVTDAPRYCILCNFEGEDFFVELALKKT